jgi:hypothetical protein
MSTDELKTQQDEINLIDQTRAEGMMAAEKKSCKLRQFAWSPKLKKSILLVFLWKQTLSMCRTGIDKQKFLQKLAEATNDPSAIDNNLSIKACSKALRLAQKELKDVKKNHEILRQQFLYERQIELSDDPKQKVNKEIVQRIQRAEEKRLSHCNRMGKDLRSQINRTTLASPEQSALQPSTRNAIHHPTIEQNWPCSRIRRSGANTTWRNTRIFLRR